MSKPLNDGGSAFPVSVGMGPLSANFASPGMSLRDWFAALAMQAMTTGVDEPNETWIASHAYFLADAMIAERNKTK